MPISSMALKALIGGLAVVGFSLIGHAGHPKRFAGLFSAAPSVAVASLAITAIVKGADGTVPYARGMLVGSAGMLVYGVVSLYLIQRLHALIGSILAWLAWLVVAGGLYLVLGR
ncbi:MAG: DUF3147 family protein [Chloroflexi bacterium]|nr:MAG: DUF3147 family protein [Chloroflexota bacterium]